MPIGIGRVWGVDADRAGLLYPRINDDILSDNDGFIVVRVTVEAVE